jgi:hypothetical protein
MTTGWLLSGLGLGAGLLYLLDPAKGDRRRNLIRAQLAAYGRQTEDFLDSTTRALGQPAYDLLTKVRGLSPQRGRGERLMAQAEQRGRTQGLFILGCVGLGAAMAYLLEPSGGPRRRALLRDTARAYWRKTEHVLRPSAGSGQQHTRGPSQEDIYVVQQQ